MDISHTPIRVMEPAITERLRLAFPERDFQIQRVPPVLTTDEFKRIVRLTPFIGLAWMGFRPDPDAGRTVKAVMNWRLMLVVKASSTLETRFKGDKRDIGLDAMIDVALVLLQGAVFENIGSCSVTRAEAIFADGWADDATVLAQVDFDIRFSATPAALQLRTVDDFSALQIEWLTGGAHDPDVEEIISPTDEEANG